MMNTTASSNSGSDNVDDYALLRPLLHWHNKDDNNDTSQNVMKTGALSTEEATTTNSAFDGTLSQWIKTLVIRDTDNNENHGKKCYTMWIEPSLSSLGEDDDLDVTSLALRSDETERRRQELGSSRVRANAYGDEDDDASSKYVLLCLTATREDDGTYSIFGRYVRLNDENENQLVGNTLSSSPSTDHARSVVDKYLGNLTKSATASTNNSKATTMTTKTAFVNTIFSNLGSLLTNTAHPDEYSCNRNRASYSDDDTTTLQSLSDTTFSCQGSIRYSLYSSSSTMTTPSHHSNVLTTSEAMTTSNLSFWQRRASQQKSHRERDNALFQDDATGPLLVASIMYEVPSLWQILQHGIPPRRAILAVNVSSSSFKSTGLGSNDGKKNKKMIVLETKEPYRMASSSKMLQSLTSSSSHNVDNPKVTVAIATSNTYGKSTNGACKNDKAKILKSRTKVKSKWATPSGTCRCGLNFQGRGRYPSCKNVQLCHPPTTPATAKGRTTTGRFHHEHNGGGRNDVWLQMVKWDTNQFHVDFR